MKPNLGDVIADKYRLDRVLGEGGMSTVYAATNTLTRKQVAIKWLQPDASQDDEQSQRLLREAQAASAIDHPNVVNVFDVGRHEGAMFLVMELLHGEPLAALLTRQEATQPFAPHEFVRLMLPVLRGVAAAHRMGVVHRDLKPDNIFLCRDPHDDELRAPKVLDFGISKLTHAQGELKNELTREGTVFGTPQYMAPEQMRDARVADPRSDVYALGVIFYRALSGQYPHDADTLAALAIRIVEGNVVPLWELCPHIDVALSDAIMRALTVEPEHRYPTVSAFAHALEPYTEPKAEITRPFDFGDEDDELLDEPTTVLHVSDIEMEASAAAKDDAAKASKATPGALPAVVDAGLRAGEARTDHHADVDDEKRRVRVRRGALIAAMFAIGLVTSLAYKELVPSTGAPSAKGPTAIRGTEGARPSSSSIAKAQSPEHTATVPTSHPAPIVSPLDAATHAPPSQESATPTLSAPTTPPERPVAPEKRKRAPRAEPTPSEVELIDDLGPIQAERNPYLRR